MLGVNDEFVRGRAGKEHFELMGMRVTLIVMGVSSRTGPSLEIEMV